jgi:hypothetical protein
MERLNLMRMSAEDLLSGCRHILEEMKPVGDLSRIGRALPNAGGIRFRSVSGHHLDLGMSLEPSGNGFRGPVLQ